MPLLLPPGLTRPRKWTTARNYDRATYGGHVAAIAAEMGQPLLPWQKYVADVALEVDEHGVFWYSSVVVTVQRQAGKTTLDLACSIQNALLGPNRRTWYTAQSGQHASEKFLEMAELWEGSKIKSLAPNPRRSNGSQALEFVQGSKFRPHPPTADALHGKQGDRLSTDEVWYFTVLALSLMKQAASPTQTTRRKVTGQRPQRWFWSTEGTVESTGLNAMLEEARSADRDERQAFFDWGLDDDDDPSDLPLVYSKHPGAGHLFEMDDLHGFAAEYKDAPGEFARAYGNRRTGATERVIPLEPWKAAAWRKDFDAPAEPGPTCFGVQVGVDDVDTTIVATQIYGPGSLSAVVRDGHQPGSTWALPRMEELQARHPEAAFAIDKYGPSAALHDAAERAGLRMVELGAGDVIAATQNTVSGIKNPAGPTWRYKPHDALEAAAGLATKRFVGDGTWLFGRRASVGSISALEAANLGAYGVLHMPAVMALQLS
jgi:hypothetical protein